MKHLFLIVVLLSAGCSRETAEQPSATRGPLQVVAAADLAVLVDTLAYEFARQYPDVRPSVTPASTREAIVHLLNDSVSTVCTDRPLNAEEQRVAADAGIGVTETRIGWDALAVVVHRSNRVAVLTREQLAAIVSGRTRSWSDIRGSGRSGPVEFVLTGRNSGLYELVQTLVAGGDGALTLFATGETQAECAEYVGRSERGLSIVSMRAARRLPPTARLVPVEFPADSAGTVMQPVLPSPMTVYTGEYGLRHGLYIITTERRSLTGAGFSTFLRTTLPQKMIQNAGLVPSVIPNRVIQLTSE